MRTYLLLFLLFFINIFKTKSYPTDPEKSKIAISDPNDRGVLPNIDAYLCTNKDLLRIVYNAMQNITDTDAIAVDQIQLAIETALQPKFQSSGGTWLVSVTSYHRVQGYVDDRAVGMDTFCAVNDPNKHMYFVIMKIDK